MPDDLRTQDHERNSRADRAAPDPTADGLENWRREVVDKARNEAPDENGADGGDAGPDSAEESPPRRPSLLRRHPVWILFGVLAVAALAVGGYVLWLVFFYPYETTDDAFVDARQFSVAAKVSGYVAEVRVTDNQHVDAGVVILAIDPRDYQIALDQANAQVEAANASIRSADAQIASANASVDEARAQIASTQAVLQFAQEEANRQQELVKTGAGTLQAAQQATSNLQQTQATFRQNQASLASAVKNVAAAQAQKANATASLHQAEAQVEEAQQNLSYTTIVAAQPGRVVRLTGAKGQFLDAGQAVSMFVPDEKWVTANFKETQITDMRPGQPVDIRIDAYPDHPLTGRIASVQPGSGTAFSLLPAENATGNYVKVTQRVPVKITVDNWPQDVSIGPGMSVVPTATVRPRN